MKKIIEALEFYRDHEIDEVILEEGQNRFLQKNEVGDELQNINLRAKELEVKEKIVEVKKDDLVQRSSDKISVNQPKSTFDAISNLAQRAKLSAGNGFSNLNNGKFMSLDEIVAKAKKAAEKCKNLEELRKAVENFDGCGLKKMATNTVFCDGDASSKVMVIGEAPGNHEDLQGIPFCGDSGKLLDAMFAQIGLTRESGFYITNVIFWRPPGNRRPTDEELQICRPFVERHIQLVDPKIIILVGATSMSAVLGVKDPVSKVRGEIIDFAPDFMDRKIDSFVIFHPSYLMRQSAKKRIAWRDMLKLEKILKEG